MIRYLILYDIGDDKLRTRLSRLLLGYGFRVQDSVFECLLTPSQAQHLYTLLQSLELEKGSIRLYRICKSCEKQMLLWGHAPQVEDPDYYLV